MEKSICMNLRSLASCVRRRHFVMLGDLASRHRFGSFWDHVQSGSAKPAAAGMPGAGKKNAVHGKCFYTHIILWAILTGYLC